MVRVSCVECPTATLANNGNLGRDSGLADRLLTPCSAKLEAGMMVMTPHGVHLQMGDSALVLLKTVACSSITLL